MLKKALKGLMFAVLFLVIAVVMFCLINGFPEKKEEDNDFELKDSIYTQSNEEDMTNKDRSEDSIEPHDIKIEGTTQISDVVKNVMPSIVSITVKQTVIADSFFYGRYETETISVGSGIIISYNNQEILISTNNHVVSDGKEMVIKFYDGSTANGKVKGADWASDLAVISVNKSDLSIETLKSIKVASLGDVKSLRVGESVIAVGNAMGYGNSVTTGILSAKDREIDITDMESMKLLQTDAAINPGNSGGALINLKGEVIGINSVKYVSTDTERVGYAIPIDKAIPILNDLINYEEINEEDRGYLGITGKDVNESFSVQYSAPYGVYVYEIEKDSPADKAGLETGDIITSFNGREVKSMEEISDILKYKRVGDVCKTTVSRFEKGEYKEYQFEIELSKKPE